MRGDLIVLLVMLGVCLLTAPSWFSRFHQEENNETDDEEENQ